MSLSLTTTVNVPAGHRKITYVDTVFMLGSCFTEHISRKLNRYKYRVMTNPNGILYNPVSMAEAMERIANQQLYVEEELVQHDGRWHSMDHHGSFSRPDKEIMLAAINDKIIAAHDFLKNGGFAFISPGTSVVYRYKATGKISGNCHKIPAREFDAFRLTLGECVDACHRIVHALRSLNPAIEIIWTVSPVRHIKDGLAENQKSKATLLLAIDEVMRHQERMFYFPAYEIMIDELRDYRYYDRDHVHPTELAIDIIWERFAGAWLEPHECEHHTAIEKIKRAMEHRFLHDNREAIRHFARGQLAQIDKLAGLMPESEWREERQYFFQLTEMD